MSWLWFCHTWIPLPIVLSLTILEGRVCLQELMYVLFFPYGCKLLRTSHMWGKHYSAEPCPQHNTHICMLHVIFEYKFLLINTSCLRYFKNILHLYLHMAANISLLFIHWHFSPNIFEVNRAMLGKTSKVFLIHLKIHLVFGGVCHSCFWISATQWRPQVVKKKGCCLCVEF